MKIIDLDTISFLSEKIQISSEVNVFKMGIYASDLIFLCKGRIKIYNGSMLLYNEYDEGEIILFD